MILGGDSITLCYICPKMIEVSIEVTHACPLRCLMCSSSAEYPSPIQNELTLSEIKKIINDAKSLGASIVSLSGGEPTQRSDIYDILQYCYENNMKVLYYSCGVVRNGDEYNSLDDKLLRLLSKINATLILDIQSDKPKVHDKIMQIDGAHELVCDTLMRAMKNNVTVETHFVPQKLNFNDIEDYVLWLDGLGVKKTSFLRLVPQGRAIDNYDEVMINKKQFREMQEIFCDLTSDDNVLNIEIRLGHPIDRRWMLEPESGKYPIKCCRGGDQAPLIKPDGQVDMCPGYKDLVEFCAGNVRDKSLADIWTNSEFYKTFRWFIREGYKEVDNECRDCPYLTQCKCGCTAQRLLEFKKQMNTDKISFRDALIHAPPDPMCLLI